MIADRSSERGGIIIYIFIMAAMFAALSYAASSGFRLGSGEMKAVSEEKMRLAFTEVQDVVQAHRTAIQKMVMIDKIPFTMIDGGYAEGALTYSLSEGSCTTDACRLFSPVGGGLRWYKFTEVHPELSRFPGSLADWPADFTHGIFKTPVSGAGSTKYDPIYFLAITRDFCVFINQQIGVIVDIDTTDSVTISTTAPFRAFTDNFTESHGSAFTAPGQGGHLRGRKEGCYRVGAGEYRYFALLYAR